MSKRAVKQNTTTINDDVNNDNNVILSPVLGALSAAGEVIIAKVGDTRVLSCGIGSWKQSVMWYRGSDLILEDTAKGVPRKGTHK